MPIFHCARFPVGEAPIRVAPGVLVVFRDGRAEVDDSEIQAALHDLPTAFGVTQVAEAADAGTPTPDDPPADPNEMPPGMSVSATQTWVGADKARAEVALAAENATVSPRSTLVTRLEAVLAAE